MSYFTPDEKLRLSFEPFKPGDPPIGYMDVSRTQLSIARFSGGITVQGRHRWRKEEAKAAKKALPPQVQGELL